MGSTLDVGRRLVQMFWDPEPVNDTARDQPVWCLGSSYKLNKANASDSEALFSPLTTEAHTPEMAQATHNSPMQAPKKPLATPPDSTSSSFDASLAYDEAPLDAGWPPAFLDDLESRVWMTYRSGFQPIAKSNNPKAVAALSLKLRLRSLADQTDSFTSDSGWGCMIRSGQSLLANAMIVQRLGRAWRRNPQGDDDEKKILSLFADDARAPYSVHNFVRHGAMACGKFPGEWFGPSATARCIEALTNATESNLRVYSTGASSDVYQDNFMKIAKPHGTTFHPTLVLVGTRLGIDNVTPVYWEALIASLQMKQSIGIAGGRPSSSHYFVGVQGLHLFYLDPHYTRPGLPYHECISEYTQDEVNSCHTRKLRRLHVKEMDPSMLIGFLIRDQQDWEDWSRGVKHVQGKAIIHVSEHDPAGQAEHGDKIDQVEAMSDDEDDTIMDA